MPFAFRTHRRSGLTLVEILIALSMTLIVLGVMTSAFRFASEEMQNGRALIELANRARIVEDQLRTDLGNLTVETRVYDGTDKPNGYFEYIEGVIRDNTFAASVDNFQGDCDDILAFTARSSDGALYRGRSTGAAPVIESSVAEIVWFCSAIGDNAAGQRNQVGFQEAVNVAGITNPTISFDETIRVHRRVLLIRPDLATVATGLDNQGVIDFILNNDISVRVVPTTGGLSDLIANSLEDLATRSNRFARDNGALFPNNLINGNLQLRSVDSEDLPAILSDVGAFDVRAYSPTARVGVDGGVIVEPSDPGYGGIDQMDITPPNLEQLGAYVDLGYLATVLGSPIPQDREDEWFGENSTPPLNASSGWIGNVWDTWTPEYENDGIDQDLNLGVDQGTNGVDNGGSNVIDDPAERETIPPYTQPIRGLKITLRLVEKGTKQVHQISIIHSFVPE